MSRTLKDKRKIAAKIYRKAATIAAEHPFGCCTSITIAAADLDYHPAIGRHHRALFADVFYKCETRRSCWLFGPFGQYNKRNWGFWFGDMTVENQEHRVLSLCLMANAVERGGFDKLLLQHWR